MLVHYSHSAEGGCNFLLQGESTHITAGVGVHSRSSREGWAAWGNQAGECAAPGSEGPERNSPGRGLKAAIHNGRTLRLYGGFATLSRATTSEKKSRTLRSFFPKGGALGALHPSQAETNDRSPRRGIVPTQEQLGR